MRPKPMWNLGLVAVVMGAVITMVLPRAPSARPDNADTRTIFLRDCAVCHGADARGTSRGPDLRGAGRATVDYELSTGRMPLRDPGDEVERRTPAYSPAPIAALVAHVAALVPDGPDIPDVSPGRGSLAHGGEVFRAQ